VSVDKGSLKGRLGDEAFVFLDEADEDDVPGLLQHVFYGLEAEEGKGAPFLAQAFFDQREVLRVVPQLRELLDAHRHRLEVGVVNATVLPLLPGSDRDRGSGDNHAAATSQHAVGGAPGDAIALEGCRDVEFVQ
jgi:hypothetical protein